MWFLFKDDILPEWALGRHAAFSVSSLWFFWLESAGL
jgi:hypothetical protein